MELAEKLLERNKWDKNIVHIIWTLLRDKGSGTRGWGCIRKDIEKFLQKAVHPLIHQRSEE